MKNFLDKISVSRFFPMARSKVTGHSSDDQQREPKAKIHYELTQDYQLAAQLFQRLCNAFVKLSESNQSGGLNSPLLRVEFGRLAADGRYMYLQPWDNDGFLAEQRDQGWLIAKAHKIEQTSRFMRESESWDVVNILQSNLDGGLPRLSSQRYRNDGLLSYLVYESRILSDWRRYIGCDEES